MELTSIIRSDKNLTTREKAGIALRLSAPAILAQLSSIAMQYIDAAMVGRLGATASASIGLVSAVIWLMSGVTSAVSYGYSVQVAQGLGAGEGERVRNVIRQGIITLLVFSALVGMVAVAISGELPKWIGGAPELYEGATGYFRTYAMFLPAVQFMYFGSALLTASGDTKTAGILEIFMCIEDVILNALLIFPAVGDDGMLYTPLNFLSGGADATGASGGLMPLRFGAGLGVTGAALGTCIAYTLTAGLMLYFALVRSEALHFRKEDHYKWNPEINRRALRIGGPMALESAALSGAQVVSTAIVAPLGTVAVAAHSFAITAEALCYMPGYGLEGSATTLVGQAYGAGKKKLAKSFGWITIGLGMAIMAGAAVVMFFVSPYIFAFLTPDPAVQELGVEVLRIELLAEAMYGASIVAAGALRGAGDTMMPAAMSLVSMWGVRLTLAAILVGPLGLRGVWIAMAVELTFRGVIFLIRFARTKYLKESA